MPIMLSILGAPGPFPGYQEVVVTGLEQGVSYPLIGNNAADQMESLRLLAQQMQAGEESLITNINVIVDIENLGPGANELVVNQLFAQSEGLFYADEVVCYAAEGSTLIDILEGAGEALAALL